MIIDNIAIEVIHKKIKNVYMRVHLPTGRVRVSAPQRMSADAIRTFVVARWSWVQKQQDKVQRYRHSQKPEQTFSDGEQHAVWGHHYRLCMQETLKRGGVVLHGDTLFLYVKEGATALEKAAVLEVWYRAQLKQQIPLCIEKWQKIMGVQVNSYGIKNMKTRWGTCNTRAKRIWISLELAKLPPECLEYIVVHEMVHLFERRHNDRFYALMDHFLPGWQAWRQILKQQAA